MSPLPGQDTMQTCVLLVASEVCFFTPQSIAQVASGSGGNIDQCADVIATLEGSLLGLFPVSGEWRPLHEGDALCDHMLLQARAAFRLRVLASKERPDYPSKQRNFNKFDILEIESHVPTLLRFDASSARKSIRRNVLIDATDGGLQSFIEAPKKAVAKEIRMAWERVDAVTAMTNEESAMEFDALNPNVNTPEIKWPGLIPEISILAPFDNAIFYESRFPLDFIVSWAQGRGPSAGDRFKEKFLVYLWTPNSERANPIGVVQESQLVIHIPAPGSYLVQVTSADGRKTSKIIHFVIEGGISEGVIARRDPSGQNAADSSKKTIDRGAKGGNAR